MLPKINGKTFLECTKENLQILIDNPDFRENEYIDCKRYKTIKVQYQTLEMQTRTKNFTGWTAQIIQHEVDHCNGILI